MSAFNCRAVLLLQKELSKLYKLDLWGVHVDILDDNIFRWKLILSGLKGTSWEGSRFEILFLFSEEYNLKPPCVSFQTIPMHPNVDNESGTVCLDCLLEWNRDYSMSYVILSLQHMLSEPSLNSPINRNAARLAIISPNHYKQIILDCVFESQKEKHSNEKPVTPTILDATLPNSISYEDINEGKPTRSSNRYKLSYEDYLKQWKTIGTTQSGLENSNKFVETINVQNGDLNPIEGGISEETLKGKMQAYVSFDLEKSKKHRKTEQLKATRMQLLKDIRGNKRGGMNLSVSLPASPDETIEDDFEVDNIEVNSLVSWTQNLPSD